MIFNEGYYHAMDRGYYSDLGEGEPVMVEKTSKENDVYIPANEIGVSANPFEHQLQALSARIKEGAGKIEFEFMGTGKGNKERFTPESFGTKERTDMRELAKINEIKTSTHAAVHSESLAGLGREGFDDQTRHVILKEIDKAIDFAATATRGGAVVFHTSEWQRPISEKYGKEFLGYPEEAEKAPVLVVVDTQTGRVEGLRKDYKVYEPVFLTAKDFANQGKLEKRGNKIVDKQGKILDPEDWVDINGKYIDTKDTNAMFNRVPKWNAKGTNFDVKAVSFKDFEDRAKKYEEKTGEKVSPEVLFYRTQLQNQALQAKGNSLYHAREYEQLEQSRKKLHEALNFYEKLEKNIPENEKWKIMEDHYPGHFGSKFMTPDRKKPSEILNQELKNVTDHMRYIHESSASADAQAKQVEEQMNRISNVEDYGIKKTADTIARAAMSAMKYTNAHKKELDEPIYVAPENWDTHAYGSHPEEIRRIIEESRKDMVEKLKREGYSKGEAEEKAKTHIKATIDIGHLNMWRQHFKDKEGEKPDDRDKRFNKWVMGEMEKLAKDGIIGHVHLSDNFGYDDEHLTIGQGNAPIKDFVKMLEKHGIKDMIVESGSFNPLTILPDTWAELGNPVYGIGRGNFRSFRNAHFGYGAPPNYIVGAYSPSNEWKLWSEVPFE